MNEFFNFFFGEYLFLLIDIFFIISILLLLCFGIYFLNIIKSLVISKIIIDLSIPIFVFLIFFNLCFFNINIDIIYLFNFKIDKIIILLKIVIIFVIILYFYYFNNIFLIEKLHIFEYPIIILLSLEGAFLLLSSYDLFVIYLALELQNFGFYIMSSINRYSSFSTEAGLKYFFLGAFSSSLFLYGISIIYGLFGTLNLFDIYILLNNNIIIVYSYLFFISMFFLFSSLIFKLGGVPFHWWLPDIYDGSPTVTTMYFSIVPKLVYVYLFIKIIFNLFLFEKLFLNTIFLFVGLFSLIFGIVSAMYQYRIKRFLAYSAIANIGYVFIVLSSCNYFSIFSSLFFIFCYVFSIILIFIFLLNYRKINLFEFINIYELSLINKTNSILSLILVFTFISFAGIPPMIGFFGKFVIFFSIINDNNYLLLLIVLLLSIVSSFYYIRIIRFIFFNKLNEYIYIRYFNSNLFFIMIFYFNIFFLFFFDLISENLFFYLINVY